MHTSDRKCSECSCVVADGSLFCHRCGSKIEEACAHDEKDTGKCPSCRNNVESDQKYCSVCGTKLVEEAESVRPADETRDGTSEREVGHVSRGAGADEEHEVRTAPPPSLPAIGQLTVISSEDHGRTFPVSGEKVTIGNGPGVDIALPLDRYVSRFHARILANDGVAKF